MKRFRFSSHTPTPPSDLQVRAWRLDASPDAPQLSLTDLQPFNMDGTTLSKPQTSVSSPNLLPTRPRSSSAATDGPSSSPSTNLLQTPTVNRLPSRRVLHKPPPSDLSASPHNAIASSPLVAQTASPSTDQPSDAENGSSPWCGAVGHASLGRSGRMIERLQAEIDRIKRELNAEIQHRQEIEKREDMSSRTISGLKAENENLGLAKEVDASVIKRRDRRIDDLKAELDAERSRRVELEREKKEAEKLRDEAVAREWKEVSEAKEVAKRASSHADVLELSHRQLATEYRQRTETFTKDLSKLTDDRDEEKKKVKQLGHVVDQLQREIDKVTKINQEMTDAFTAYQDGTETRIREMEETARRHETEEAELRAETVRVVGEARWLINIGKNVNKLGDYLPLEDRDIIH